MTSYRQPGEDDGGGGNDDAETAPLKNAAGVRGGSSAALGSDFVPLTPESAGYPYNIRAPQLGVLGYLKTTLGFKWRATKRALRRQFTGTGGGGSTPAVPGTPSSAAAAAAGHKGFFRLVVDASGDASAAGGCRMRSRSPWPLPWPPPPQSRDSSCRP